MDCYCGVKGDKMTKANETDCDMPCHGNNTQICGGIYRLSVYEIFFGMSISHQNYNDNFNR